MLSWLRRCPDRGALEIRDPSTPSQNLGPASREKADGTSNDFLSPSTVLRGADDAAAGTPRPGVQPVRATGDDRGSSVGLPSPVAFSGFGDRDPPSLNKRVVRPHIQAARDARLRPIDEGQVERTPSVESQVAGPPTQTHPSSSRPPPPSRPLNLGATAIQTQWDTRSGRTPPIWPKAHPAISRGVCTA